LTNNNKNNKLEELTKTKLKQQDNYKTVEAKNALKTVRIGFRRRGKE
jgi:hypothetical protein